MSGYPTFFFEPRSQSPVFGIPQLGSTQPRHPHHHHHHAHPGQARSNPFESQRHGRASPPSAHTTSISNHADLDAEEQQLIAQLERLRARKVQAQAQAQAAAAALAEKKRRDEANARLYQEMQRRIVLERQQQQQQAERLEAERAYRQQVQESRQLAAFKAIQAARQQAAEIEAVQARERRARQIQAQQEYFAQHQRAQEERQRQIKMREEEQRRLIEIQLARQRQAREQAFWEQVESACAPARRAPTPSTPAPVQPKAQTPTPARAPAQPQPKEEEAMSGLPIDILKMIFGPDVFVANQPSQGRERSAPTSQAATPKPATPVKQPTPVPAAVSKDGQAKEVDVGQQFIDDLFGAFSHAFGLNDEDEAEEQTTKSVDARTKSEQSAPAQPIAEEQAEPVPVAAEPSASGTATPANPAEAPTPKTSNEEDEVPASAADLEAEKAQATADLIQAKYRQHLLRVTRLEKLEGLENKLEKLDEGWTFPEVLDFLPETDQHDKPKALADVVDSASSQSENLIVPPLAFTPTNVPYHAHAQALLGLLVAADAISSDGDEQVRSARREFVKSVEGKLGEMEVGRRRVWERIRGEKIEVKKADEPEVQDDKPKEPETAMKTSVATPVAVPSQETLPQSQSNTTESSTATLTGSDLETAQPTEQATADIESARPLEDVQAQIKDAEDTAGVDTGRAFSDSEDDNEDEVESERREKKEEVGEFVVV